MRERGPVALFGAIVAIGVGPALWLGAQFGNTNTPPPRPPAVVAEINKAPGGAAGAEPGDPAGLEPTRRAQYMPLASTPTAHPYHRPSTRAPEKRHTEPTTPPPSAATTAPTPTAEPSTPPTESTTAPTDPPTTDPDTQEPTDPAPPQPPGHGGQPSSPAANQVTVVNGTGPGGRGADVRGPDA